MWAHVRLRSSWAILGPIGFASVTELMHRLSEAHSMRTREEYAGKTTLGVTVEKKGTPGDSRGAGGYSGKKEHYMGEIKV